MRLFCLNNIETHYLRLYNFPMQKQSYNSLEEIFDVFNQLKILVIGDVMIDSYLWGKVERISPEAPVPILNVQKREIRLGGAANVALNVQALGAEPILCSVIGNDIDGNSLLKLLEENKLNSEGIISSEERITTIKHRVISGSHHLLRVDQETDKEITKKEKSDLIEKITALLEKVDAVIFEDYDKGVLNEEVISAVIARAKAKNIPTIVDPKKRNFSHYKGATLFKPNKKELKEGLKIDSDLNDLKEIEESVQQLKDQLQLESVLITLSENGVYIQNEKEQIHLPAHIRKIADVSGAGDTVVSTAALCVALGLSAKTIASLSNLAGGLVCEQVGVVPIEKSKLLKEAITEAVFTKGL
jgi:rfaE bifunctional protein kinase chain/domain